mmetsp:Transcript_38073/g.67999  ORF Transcript_38073/g.67999 Transcript_38073/m.67999 type:complete len:84 (+) Transcript_38073:21-272(+)
MTTPPLVGSVSLASTKKNRLSCDHGTPQLKKIGQNRFVSDENTLFETASKKKKTRWLENLGLTSNICAQLTNFGQNRSVFNCF